MTGTRGWAGGGEPTLDDVLSDPIVCAVMRGDGVARADVEIAISRALGRQADGEAARQAPPAVA